MNIESTLQKYFVDLLQINFISSLPLRDLCNIACLNKHFYRLSNDQLLWKGLFLRFFKELKETKSDWKKEFMKEYLNRRCWNPDKKSPPIVLENKNRTVMNQEHGKWCTCQLGTRPIPSTGRYEVMIRMEADANRVMFGLVENNWNFDQEVGIHSYPGSGTIGTWKTNRPDTHIIYFNRFAKDAIITMVIDADKNQVEFIDDGIPYLVTFERPKLPMIIIIAMLADVKVSCVSFQGSER